MKRLPLLVAPVDRDEMSPVDGKDGVVVGLTGADNLLVGAVAKQCTVDDFGVVNNTVTEARPGFIVSGSTTSETRVGCTPLDTNAAKDNEAVGEWVLGPGQTDGGSRTNKSYVVRR